MILRRLQQLKSAGKASHRRCTKTAVRQFHKCVAKASYHSVNCLESKQKTASIKIGFGFLIRRRLVLTPVFPIRQPWFSSRGRQILATMPTPTTFTSQTAFVRAVFERFNSVEVRRQICVAATLAALRESVTTRRLTRLDLTQSREYRIKFYGNLRRYCRNILPKRRRLGGSNENGSGLRVAVCVLQGGCW